MTDHSHKCHSNGQGGPHLWEHADAPDDEMEDRCYRAKNNGTWTWMACPDHDGHASLQRGNMEATLKPRGGTKDNGA